MVPGSPLGLLANSVKLGVLTTKTEAGQGLASAGSTIAQVGIKVPLLGIDLQLTDVHTEARSALVGCSVPAATSSLSRVATLKLNGTTTVVGDAPMTIPLLVGAIYVNQEVRVGNTVTRRAVFLDLPGTLLDIVVSESTAGAVCSPAT